VANLIPLPLSDRPLGSIDDVLPFLNKELVPLLRQIRTALNDQQAAITAPSGGGTIDVEARAAIVHILTALTGFGITP
jgi:hypothetical protein